MPGTIHLPDLITILSGANKGSTNLVTDTVTGASVGKLITISQMIVILGSLRPRVRFGAIGQRIKSNPIYQFHPYCNRHQRFREHHFLAAFAH